MTDLTKLMSVNWNKLNEIEKKKYEELSEKDKQRYEKQKKEFEETGKFTTGSNSQESEEE